MSDSEEELTLSSHTLAALAAFQQEEQSQREKFQALSTAAQDRYDEHQRQIQEQGMALFKEDWQLSQFWYSDDTSLKLAKELFDGAKESDVICIVSAPSVYAAMMKIEHWPTKEVYLLEYDTRFEVLAGEKFFFYDYNRPQDIPESLALKCDRVLADPPFIEDECQRKTGQTIHNLLKKGGRFLTCTGERVGDLLCDDVHKNLGLKRTGWEPEHANGLSNEFMCYANYETKFCTN